MLVALVAPGEKLLCKGVFQPEIEPMCGVLEAGTRVLARQFDGNVKDCVAGLKDVSALEKHLRHMCKELTSHRPNIVGFLDQVMMRFHALKGKLVAGHLSRISQDFTASLGRIEPVSDLPHLSSSTDGHPDGPSGSEGLPQVLKNLTIASIIDADKSGSVLLSHGVDGALIRRLKETAISLKNGVPSVGEIITKLAKGASEVIDAHTVVEWYHNKAEKSLKVMESKVEVLVCDGSTDVVCPDIIQVLHTGVLELFQYGEEKIHGAAIDWRSRELDECRGKVLLTCDKWNNQGQELISARKEKRKWLQSLSPPQKKTKNPLGHASGSIFG